MSNFDSVNLPVASPHARRPEPPSQGHDALAESGESRVCPGTPGLAQQPLTHHGPGQNGTETVAQGDGCGDDPHAQRLVGQSSGAAKRPARPKRRRLKIDVLASLAVEVEALADQSGLARSQFMPAALALGARKLAAQLAGDAEPSK